MGRVGVLLRARQDPLSRTDDAARRLVRDLEDACARVVDGKDDGALEGGAAAGRVGHHGAEVRQCVERGEEGRGNGRGVGGSGGGES